VFGQTSHVVEPLVGATRAAAFSMRPCGRGEGLLGGFLDQMPVELLEQAGGADVAFGPRDVSGVRAWLIENAGRVAALMLPLRRRERPFPGGVVEDRAIHPAREHAIGLSQVAGLELSVATRLPPPPGVQPESGI